jgi:hypothetical protein
MRQLNFKINSGFSRKLPPPNLFPAPPVQIRDTLSPLQLRIDRTISRRRFGHRNGDYRTAYEEMCELVRAVIRSRGYPARSYQ